MSGSVVRENMHFDILNVDKRLNLVLKGKARQPESRIEPPVLSLRSFMF